MNPSATLFDTHVHVLSIDGGGIRGIIPAEILDYITARTGLAVHEMFDLVAGTSTGGIIALGVGTNCKSGTAPYTPRELVQLYVDNGAKIFPKSVFSGVKELFGPKYSAQPLEQVLAEYFGDTMLDSALTPLLIASYDLASQTPFFFKSHKIGCDDSYDVLVQKVARATSAAPTYFPPLQMTFPVNGQGKAFCLVDGGVCANNPAIAAYAEAKMLYRDLPQAEFLVVSLGTGDRKDNLDYRSAGGWCLVKWAKMLVPVFMDSVSESVDYELQWIDPAAFCRFQDEELPAACSAMDNATPENIQALQDEASKFITANKDKLDSVCQQLNRGRGTTLPGIGPTKC
jgi:hypothetical protein